MKKGDIRRVQILDAAEKLFFEQGYDRTSVQDILGALQMSKGGFYHYFDAKDSVLQAVSERRAQGRFDQLTASMGGWDWPSFVSTLVATLAGAGVAAGVAWLEEDGIDTSEIDVTSDYWYFFFAKEGEEKAYYLSLSQKLFTKEEALAIAETVDIKE